MKTLLSATALLFASLLTASAAMATDLSPNSSRLVAAQAALAKDPTSQKLQHAYVEAFPATSTSFRAVFSPDDFGQLYNESYAFVSELGRIGERCPRVVLEKGLRVASSLEWDADGINYLQGMITDLAAKRPREFSDALRSLPRQDQEGALGFLVSGPHRPTQDFYALVLAVRASGDTALASRLSKLAKQRKSRGPHAG